MKSHTDENAEHESGPKQFSATDSNRNSKDDFEDTKSVAPDSGRSKETSTKTGNPSSLSVDTGRLENPRSTISATSLCGRDALVLRSKSTEILGTIEEKHAFTHQNFARGRPKGRKRSSLPHVNVDEVRQSSAATACK